MKEFFFRVKLEAQWDKKMFNKRFSSFSLEIFLFKLPHSQGENHHLKLCLVFFQVEIFEGQRWRLEGRNSNQREWIWGCQSSRKVGHNETWEMKGGIRLGNKEFINYYLFWCDFGFLSWKFSAIFREDNNRRD